MWYASDSGTCRGRAIKSHRLGIGYWNTTFTMGQDETGILLVGLCTILLARPSHSVRRLFNSPHFRRGHWLPSQYCVKIASRSGSYAVQDNGEVLVATHTTGFSGEKLARCRLGRLLFVYDHAEAFSCSRIEKSVRRLDCRLVEDWARG